MITEILLDIQKAYNEPHRYYHTLKHINRMFEIARYHNIELSKEQVMAIWFHDYVYKVPRENVSNELLSSIEARNYLTYQTTFKCEEINTVCVIIEDTEKELPLIKPSEIVIDLDLYDLADMKTYFDNGLFIEKEFLPVFGEEEFVKGRIKWIDSMLERKSIFVSNLFNTIDMNCAALRNLKQDKALLEIRRDEKK